MGNELLALTVMGIVAPFLGIIVWQIFTERRHAKDIDYKKWHTKQIIKNPVLRVPSKQVKDVIAPAKPEQNLLGLLKNLDVDNVKSLLGMIQNNDDVDLETIAADSGGDILGTIVNYAKDNPEVVQGFLSGISKGKKEEPIDITALR